MLLGIEIGGTKLQLGLGDGGGTIACLERRAVDPPKGAEGIRAQIVEAFRELDASVEAIGIGFGGPVEADRGVVTKSNQIEGWDGFPIVAWAREALGVPIVALQNDADTAALGEARFGAGRGLSPVLYVNSGSGIGGGLVIDGRIYRGSGRGAMEIGHTWVPDRPIGGKTLLWRRAAVLLSKHSDLPDGPAPEMARLEDVASGWAIASEGAWLVKGAAEPSRLAILAANDPSRVTASMVAGAARLGDSGARMILDRATAAMGIALAHAVTLLAPRRVILGGGVSLMDRDLWLEPICQALGGRVFPPFRGTFDVVTADLGEDVVVHGALALARDAVDDAAQ